MAVEELIDRYIKIRDRKAQIKEAYEDQVGTLDAALKKIETALLAKMNEEGLDSFTKKGVGVAFKSRVTSATVADWDSFLGFIKANDTWHLLDRRCSKTAVVDFKKTNDELPPGINWREEVVVRVNRD